MKDSSVQDYKIINKTMEKLLKKPTQCQRILKVLEETIKIGDHTYSKKEVEKRLQGLKEI